MPHVALKMMVGNSKMIFIDDYVVSPKEVEQILHNIMDIYVDSATQRYYKQLAQDEKDTGI